MSDRTSSWPLLLFLATLTALVSIVIGIALWREVVPATWGTAIHWGLASASLTFTLVHLFHTRHVTRSELMLLVIAPCSLISHSFVIAAAVLLVIGIVGWLVDELF